jgi:hypothetical protein
VQIYRVGQSKKTDKISKIYRSNRLTKSAIQPNNVMSDTFKRKGGDRHQSNVIKTLNIKIERQWGRQLIHQHASTTQIYNPHQLHPERTPNFTASTSPTPKSGLILNFYPIWPR